MSFDFNYYLNGGLINPIIIGTLISFFLLNSVISVCKTIRFTSFEKSSLLKEFAIVIGFLLLLSINIVRLSNGGFWLLFENESDSITTQGEISSIEEISTIRFPNINGYGKEITIDGEQYISMHFDEFEIGDYVTIRYLPRSKYVLSIDKTFQQQNNTKAQGSARLLPCAFWRVRKAFIYTAPPLRW